MIYFTHIPKCGGKSLRVSLEQAYGERLMLYYNNPLKKKPWRLKGKQFAGKFLRGMHPEVGEEIEIVYGHYCLDDFLKEVKQTNAFTAAFFREPIEWVGSYLLYAKQKGSQKLIGDPIEDIKRLRLTEGYQFFLGGLSVDDLSFVGLVEEYDESLRVFKEITNVSLSKQYQNKTNNAPQSYRRLFEEQGVLSEIQNLMVKNINIYNRAKERFQELSVSAGSGEDESEKHVRG